MFSFSCEPSAANRNTDPVFLRHKKNERRLKTKGPKFSPGCVMTVPPPVFTFGFFAPKALFSACISLSFDTVLVSEIKKTVLNFSQKKNYFKGRGDASFPAFFIFPFARIKTCPHKVNVNSDCVHN